MKTVTDGRVLQDFIGDLAIKVTEVAKKTGFARSTIYTHFQKDTLDFDIRETYRDKLGINWTNSGHFSTLNEPETEYKVSKRGVPYYDIDVNMAAIDIFKGKEKAEPADYFYIPGFNDCTAFVNVKGESMCSKFCSGDIIALKEISDTDVIQFGEPHVIVTKEQNIFRYLRRGIEEDKWLLESEHQDKYDSFSIAKKKVLNVFLVRGVVKPNNM